MFERIYCEAMAAIEPTQAEKAKAATSMKVLLAGKHSEEAGKRAGQSEKNSFAGGKRRARRLAMALAACLVLGAALTAPLLMNKLGNVAGPIAPAELPKLEIEFPLSGGMGFEGYILYDFSEFILDDSLLAAAQKEGQMPVYHNTMPKDQYLMFPEGSGLTEEQLQARAQEAAFALGLEVLACEPTYNTVQVSEDEVREELYAVEAVLAQGRITAFRDGSVSIQLNSLSGMEIGAPPAESAPAEDHYAYVEWLISQYSALLGYMEKPVPHISMQRDIYGSAQWSYSVYDGAKSAGEQLAAKAINPASFYISVQEGTLIIGLKDLVNPEWAGNYPMITAEEARAALVEGGGWTTAPEPFPGEEYIMGVELAYLVSGELHTFIPYYRFYVQLVGEGAALPSAAPQGLKTYGAWYVPAVQPEYLSTPEQTGQPVFN